MLHQNHSCLTCMYVVQSKGLYYTVCIYIYIYEPEPGCFCVTKHVMSYIVLRASEVEILTCCSMAGSVLKSENLQHLDYPMLARSSIRNAMSSMPNKHHPVGTSFLPLRHQIPILGDGARVGVEGQQERGQTCCLRLLAQVSTCLRQMQCFIVNSVSKGKARNHVPQHSQMIT